MKKYYVVDSGKLFDDSFAEFVKQKKERNEPVNIIIYLTNEFDPYDIEQYVNRFKELNFNEIIIFNKNDMYTKPTYKQVVEVRDALYHFCEFVSGGEEIDDNKKFRYGETEISFEFAG